MVEPLTERNRVEWRRVAVDDRDRVARAGGYAYAADRIIKLADALDAERKFSRSLVEALEALHRPDDGVYGEESVTKFCAEDGFIWPCRTARALAADPAPREEGTKPDVYYPTADDYRALDQSQRHGGS